MKYKISEYAELHHLSYRTIWNRVKLGALRVERTATNRLWIVDDVPATERKIGIYARVSSSENKANLERQKERLISYCNAKGYQVEKVVVEIGSGLNDKRPKLEKLLLDPTIHLIVVEHSDRLTRFGLNYIEKLLAQQNRSIEILNPPQDEKADLMEDFVSLVTSFAARLYGQRRSKRQTEKLIQELSRFES
jgi:putative resolvase